jgi:hypothetical protein
MNVPARTARGGTSGEMYAGRNASTSFTADSSDCSSAAMSARRAQPTVIFIAF